MAAYVILVLLALLWGAFFVSWYRSRSAQRVDSVARFSRHLSVLERATPGQVVPLRTVAPSERGVHRISSTPSVPRAVTVEPAPATTLTLAEAYQRRRTVLVGLAGSAAVTLVGALLAGGIRCPPPADRRSVLVTYLAPFWCAPSASGPSAGRR